jgi:hypothetical protein
LIAPEYDSVPGSFDPDIDDDPYFDSHADIDYAYGLGDFGYVGEYADVEEMNRQVVERAALADLWHGRGGVLRDGIY